MDAPLSLRVLIVDDEYLARERIRRLLLAAPDVAVAGLCRNGDEALAAITTHRPDAVFLDVQMPGKTGFEVLRALPEGALPLVVFVTAYDQYAIDAFEAQALDYLLKPFDDVRFYRALDRLRQQHRDRQIRTAAERLRGLIGGTEAAEPAPAERAGRLAVRTGERVLYVDPAEVDYVEAEGPYALLAVQGRRHLLRTPLHELEARLDGAGFVRIHRSTLVNLARVRELVEVSRGEWGVRLASDVVLKVSRSRRALLEARLAGAT